MATAYRAPFDPPEIDYENDLPRGVSYYDSPMFRKEQDYLQRLADEAKKNGTDPILGEIVRWGRGDGYAQYMVWRVKPLQLIHIETGDAWSVEDALIRGLRVSDLRQMIASEKRLAELFARKDPVTR